MTKEQKIIRAKVGLLELAAAVSGNVSQACKMMGYLRDSVSIASSEFTTPAANWRCKSWTRRKPILKNRTPPRLRRSSSSFRWTALAYGQIRIANEPRKPGHSISPAGVRGVRQRHDLETMKNSSSGALGAKVTQEGLVPTESQIAALAKARRQCEAHGEFESECPGYCGAQDTPLCPQHEGGRPASTSRPLSTPTPRSPSPSSMIARRPSPRLISSTIASCRSTCEGGEALLRAD